MWIETNGECGLKQIELNQGIDNVIGGESMSNKLIGKIVTITNKAITITHSNKIKM